MPSWQLMLTRTWEHTWRQLLPLSRNLSVANGFTVRGRDPWALPQDMTARSTLCRPQFKHLQHECLIAVTVSCHEDSISQSPSLLSCSYILAIHRNVPWTLKAQMSSLGLGIHPTLTLNTLYSCIRLPLYTGKRVFFPEWRLSSLCLGV